MFLSNNLFFRDRQPENSYQKLLLYNCCFILFFSKGQIFRENSKSRLLLQGHSWQREKGS